MQQCSGLTSSSTQGTLCGIGDQTQVGHMQDKTPTHYAISFAPVKYFLINKIF